MMQEFFTKLPSEIIVDILSRIPIRTIISCKCVCKSLLGLVKTREFVQSHLSKSIPGLAVHQYLRDPKSYGIFEFVDGLNLERDELPLITSFDLPFSGEIFGSASGLLSLCDSTVKADDIYVCNPITREYIQLHCAQEFVYIYPEAISYGFGVSKMTGQHKVVRICYDKEFDKKTHTWLRGSKKYCQVYTLGTRSWRRIAPGGQLDKYYSNQATFLNGNLHWMVYDSGSRWISCFDLETELFCSYSVSPLSLQGLHVLLVLGNCLCLSDNTSDNQIVVWLMKEYGVEKSWTKEFVISKDLDFACHEMSESDNVYPIKIFEDGNILMSWEDLFLFCYSTKTSATKRVGMSKIFHSVVLHSPSFLSPGNFEMEDLLSF